MLQNITPDALRCSFGGCPAVYKLPNGSLAVIGTKANPDISKELSGKVAPSEDVIVIEPEFFDEFVKERAKSI